MNEARFWFEEVPEDQKYWFLSQSGKAPSLEAKREAQLRESGLTSQDANDLQDIASDIQHASVFRSTEEEARKIREEVRERFERMEAIGYGDQDLEVPYWPVVHWYQHKEGWDDVRAPILYTEKEKAEEEVRSLEAREAEAYLERVERYGQADADEAWDNYLPYEALWVDRSTLLGKLEDSAFLCVMVDGSLRLRRDFIEDLRREEEKAGQDELEEGAS